jgi:hypothetical protein
MPRIAWPRTESSSGLLAGRVGSLGRDGSVKIRYAVFQRLNPLSETEDAIVDRNSSRLLLMAAPEIARQTLPATNSGRRFARPSESSANLPVLSVGALVVDQGSPDSWDTCHTGEDSLVCRLAR